MLGAPNYLDVGEENLVIILRTSSPNNLMGYLILTAPKSMWAKIIVTNKKCATPYSNYLLGGIGERFRRCYKILLQFSALFLC